MPDDKTTTTTTEKEPTGVSNPDAVPVSTPDTVTLTQDDYKSLIGRIGDLEKGRVNEAIMDEEENHTVRVRFYSGKPIIGVGKVTSKQENVEGVIKPVLHIEVFLLGEEKAVVLNYSDYMEASGLKKIDIHTCKVVDRLSKTVKATQGHTEKSEVSEWKTVGTGMMVPVRVISSKDTFVVELPDGTKESFNEEAVN